MAAARSLGIHEPAALPYLIAEGVLPPDPPRSLYTWQINTVRQEDTVDCVEEEVLATDTCAVWSRASIVKRVYNLDVEGERILRAFTTSFPRTKRISIQQGLNGRHSGNAVVSTTSETITREHATNPSQESSDGATSWHKQSERALVVVLKHQVHIFLLSGDSHVIPLSFEIEDAFPALRGFLLQRKLSKDEVRSQGVHTYETKLGIDRSHTALPVALQRLFPDQPQYIGTKPRLFCVSEVLDEVGIVVAQSADKARTGNLLAQISSPLSSDEEIVYISRRDELELSFQNPGHPLCLAVTQNTQSQNLTLWQITYLAFEEAEPHPKRRKVQSTGHVSKRKSSNVFGRGAGAATPSRTFQTRESFGALAQSFSENVPNNSVDDPKTSQTIDLETQLGHDFGEVGVQTRSARRISSMLARTDLTSGHDRTLFNDISTNQLNRNSIKRNSRRGDSMGGLGDRQSFGRRRSSFPTNGSVMSNGTSFLEVPGAHLADDMNAHEDLQELMDNDFADLNGGTQPQIAFTRIKSLPKSPPLSSQTRHVSDMPKVFTLLPSRQRDPGQKGSRQVSLCIMDGAARELAIVNLKIYQRSQTKEDKKETVWPKPSQYVRGTEVRRGSNIIDACKVSSGIDNRILILTQTRDQSVMLHLEAPWALPFRIYLPASLMVYHPAGIPGLTSPDRRRVTGQHRVVKSSDITIDGLESAGAPGEVLAVDNEGQRHRVVFQLSPTNPMVERILNICQFVLPGSEDDGLLLAWWEVMRWLQSKNISISVEYTSLIVVIFAIALPFITGKSGMVPSTPRKKKTALLRSSSGTTMDMTSWDNMVKMESQGPRHTWMTGASWSWVTSDSQVPPVSIDSRSHRSKSSVSGDTYLPSSKNTFMVDCITFAREFLQSPAGETAIGPEGYLPTAMNKDRDYRRTALPTILVSLHLYREELKLQLRSASPLVAEDLAPVIAQLGQWLGWETWTWRKGGYYNTEIPDVDQWLFEDTHINGLEIPGPPFDPPAIFTHVEESIARSRPKAFPSLLDLAGKAGSSSVTESWRASAASLTPRLSAVTELLATENLKQWTAQRLFATGIDRAMLDSLPDGIIEALRKVMVRRMTTSSSLTYPKVLGLLDRHEQFAGGVVIATQVPVTRPAVMSSHDAIRDYHSIGNIALEADNIHSWDATSEADRQGVTRLIFREDRRYQEASKLVNQTRPPMVECTPEPEWTEGDLLDAQKELAHTVAHRTLSVASGRGMMHFNARVPLLTEKVPIPAFSLQCVMKPRVDAEGSAPMTFSADKASFTEDKVCWAFFHNGASAGLMISKDAKGIDTSWILYNKPPELTNRHAGFLLALGLTGHLKNLAKWVAFKYLTPKHTMTSIGLLLGLSASYLGTMDTQITRLLSVHVTRLLPPGAAELNLSPLTQATSIMGIGLLYCRSQHRRMSEIMLSEIENNDPEEGVAEEALLRNEGYRLAAGFALGYINLGQGKKLHGLHDMGFIERLLAVAIGTKNVNLVHVLDRATAGATIAIALVFMKTSDESVAHKIDIPDTTHQFDYVRPDIFLLRTVARHLIMWNSVEPTPAFMKKSLPPAYRHRATLQSTKYLGTEDMPFFNITAGICLALGLRFAGSGSHGVRDLLVSYLDQFIRLTRLPALNYDAKLTRNSVRNCQDVVALATAAVMAGTGDLIVLRRLRALHGRTDQETPYGSHLAGHMAIGALFLGGGMYTFGTSNLAIASLLCAFYPLFPTDELDNRSHLQAFRHLWALAAEPRCIVCKDSKSGKVVSAQIDVDMRDGSTRQLTAPCLLPELATVKCVSTKEQGYRDVTLDLADEVIKDKWIKSGLTVCLRQRAAFDAPASDLFVAELATLAERGPAPSINTNANAGTFRAGQKSNDRPFDWLFFLPFLAGLDVSEHALVLPPHNHGVNDMGRLRETVVDERLELENLLNSSTISKDQLWQLRLLFAGQDMWEEEKRKAVAEDINAGVEENGGLKMDVLDRLRWKVWNMTLGSDEDANI